MDFSYGYGTSNNVGQLLSRTDAIQNEHSVEYGYDSIYRLNQVAATNGSWGISWTFDAWSNRLSQSRFGYVDTANVVASQNLAYSNNRLTAITNLTYDAAGNLTNEGTGGHTYTYNGKNQITQVDSGSGATYMYDGEGRRVKRTVNSVSTFYFYGLGGIISEFSTTGVATGASTSDKTNYQTSDRQGTAALLIAGNGLVVENNRTLPYGELWRPLDTSTTTKKYTTFERDSETNLDYAKDRYFANNLGRMQSVDSGPMELFDPRSLNRYVYTMNDPVNYTDPSGAIAEPTGPRIRVIVFPPFDTDPYFCGSSPTRRFLGLPCIYYPEELPPQRQSGSSNKKCRNWECMPDALNLALSWLDNKDGKCSAMYDTEKTGNKPQNVLKDITHRDGSTIKFINLGVNDGIARTQTINGALRVIMINTAIPPGSVSYWNSGNATENAITLLHELGHVYRNVNGLGNSSLKDEEHSKWDAKIRENCIK